MTKIFDQNDVKSHLYDLFEELKLLGLEMS